MKSEQHRVELKQKEKGEHKAKRRKKSQEIVYHVKADKECSFFSNTYRPWPAAIFLHIRSK